LNQIWKAYGFESGEDDTDCYVIAENSLNVYYLKGEKIGSEYYFSLSEKLTGKKRVNSNTDDEKSNITITKTTSGIKLTKNTSDWTNKLTVDVETTLETNETIEYIISGVEAGTSTNGTFSIDINKILTEKPEVNNAFNLANTNKTLTVNKYDISGENKVLISSIDLDISNLDILSGNVLDTSKITYKQYDDFTLVNITGYTDIGGSGVKEARVLYTEKLDSEGNKVAYYNNLPSQITSEYVKNTGISMNSNVLKLPANVSEYAIVFIDNAGNISNVGIYTVTF